MFSADNRKPQSTQKPIDHPNPIEPLAAIELQPLMKPLAMMEPKDDIGHEEPGISVALMLGMVLWAIDGFVVARGRSITKAP